jgi:hypothetical protein
MTRYPQAIHSYGSGCGVCGKPKYIHARVCRTCNPVFSSYSKAMDWARLRASGPCVVMYRNVTPYGGQGCRYADWLCVGNGAAA